MARPSRRARTGRDIELRAMLEERRRQLSDAVQGRMRSVRAEGASEREVRDEGESSEFETQEDIELALVQLQAETLIKVNEALQRLKEGSYGHCSECGDPIAEARLRALPFAVRCRDCEELRETVERRNRVLAQRSGSSPLLFDLSD